MYKIIFTLLLCCCATAYGAEVDNALLKKNLEAANLQIEVLKAQVEVMKSYQDKFLSTVYWSLGTVAALVVFLAGFNWFTNNRNAEKESALHKEMITNEFNSIKTINQQQILDLKQEFNSHLIEELDLMRDKLDKSNNNIKNELERELNKIFKNQIDSLIYEQHTIKRDLLNIEYEKWMTAGIFANAMTVAADILKLSNTDYSTSKAFDKINSVVQAMKDKNRMDCLDSLIKTKLVKSMEPFQEKYSFVIDNINRQLVEFENLKR